MHLTTARPAVPESFEDHKLRIYLLSRFQVVADDTPIKINSQKQVMLLAYLAATKQTQRRQHLVTLLWPDSKEEAALKNLRNMLWQLRNKIGSDALINTVDSVSLNFATVAVDVDWAQIIATQLFSEEQPISVERLLVLLKGKFLDDFSVNSTAANFETWLTMERSRFNQSIIATLTKLCLRFEQQACWQELQMVAAKGMQFDNLHEPFVAALMTANNQLGQRTQALRQYQLFERDLKREMGVAPSAETLLLFQTISKTDVSTVRTVDNQTSSATSNHLLPFINRPKQQQQLDQLLRRATTGGPRIGLISGRQGCGKTRFVNTFIEQQRKRKYVTASVWSHRAKKMQPYEPFVTLLRQLLQTPYVNRLSTTQSHALAHLMPEFELSEIESSSQIDIQPVRLHEVFAQIVLQCSQTIPQAPLVLGFDNSWWADKMTRDALMYVLNRLRDSNARVLLLLSVRSEVLLRADSPTDWLLQLGRQFEIERIALKPISRSEIADLFLTVSKQWRFFPVAPLLQDRFVDFLHRQSRGNMWHLTQLIQHCQTLSPTVDSAETLLSRAQQSSPIDVDDRVRVKLHRLPHVAQQLLYELAVWGKPISFAQLSTYSELSQSSLIVVIDTLLQEGIVEECSSESLPEGYRFTFPLEQAATCRQAGFGRRDVLQARIRELQTR